ncbi:hypothetical protein V502_06459 [Pseudogymnoascus sp. VKM F-4520 (FW-2644)]|nr:hypothetical protein V502_06459 [Pseudogymnoascus sp. VKM F-4520 (FW-2644)]
MGVLEQLRNNYAAAEFAMQFLAAAMQKAGIEVAESPAAAAAPNAQGALTTPPDSSMTGASWDFNRTTTREIGGEATMPLDEDVDTDMKLGCIGGEEEAVFEEQFGALVDFEEGGGEGGADMAGGMHGESGGFMIGIAGGMEMEFRGGWGRVAVEWLR